MKVLQIQNVTDLVTNWPFFAAGFRETEVTAREPVDDEALFKVMTSVIADPQKGWVGVVEDAVRERQGFAILEDRTLPYSQVRSFSVRFVYHRPGRHDASTALMRAFETWARRNGVKHYSLTTKRSSGAAIRCFESSRYGFRKSHIVFEKTL